LLIAIGAALTGFSEAGKDKAAPAAQAPSAPLRPQ
jgi:hypothetical protein